MNPSEIVVDALPYIDNEYDEPGMKEMVMTMIEDEKRRYRPTKNYLEHMPQLQLHRFETDVMKKEYDRMAQRLPMETLSMKRYELPTPPTGKLTDLTAWNECVDNSYSQLEHQATRIANLELMAEYSCESWKSYLLIIQRMMKTSKKQLQDLKKQIQELNWYRKTTQVGVGEQMKNLESSWVGLVSKNYEIEQACIALEAEAYEKKALLAQQQYLASEAEAEARHAEANRPEPEISIVDPDSSGIAMETDEVQTENGEQQGEHGDGDGDDDGNNDDEDEDEMVGPMPAGPQEVPENFENGHGE